MGIAKFDDGVPSNPKLISAGPVACWLWFCGVMYCRRGLTDGFIPKAVVPSLVIGLANPYRHAARLVDVGLWHNVAGGYEVNGFLDWNTSKEAMEEYRRKDRERKRKSHGITSDSGMESDMESRWIPSDGANARVSHAGVKKPSKSESESLVSDFPEESARETTPPRWRPAGARRADPSMRDLDYHRRHCPIWAQAACGAGICVPKYLWPQWEKRRPINDLEAFIGAWASRAAGDAAENFWPRAFEAHFGTSAPSVKGDKVTRVRSALDEALAINAAERKAVGDGRQ